MSRSRDLFLKIMERMLQDSQPAFLDHSSLDLEEETFEVNKGNYKTILKAKFDKTGRVVSTEYTSEYIPTEEEASLLEMRNLQKQIESAVEQEDYSKAHELQQSLKKLETGKKAETKQMQAN